MVDFPSFRDQFDRVLTVERHQSSVVVEGEYREPFYDRSLFEKYRIEFPPNLGGASVRRQAEFLAGRNMARQALRELQVTDTTVSIGENRMPVWPVGIVGSLTHCDSRVACLATRCQNWLAGVDLEKKLEKDRASLIESSVINADERDILRQSIKENALGTTLLFSAKESLFKALYPHVRAYFGFDAASLVEVQFGRAFVLRLNRSLAPGFEQGRCLPVNYRMDSDHVMTWLLAPMK